MCLAQGPQGSDASEAPTPAAPWSPVKHSTTEPLRSLAAGCMKEPVYVKTNIMSCVH